MTLLVLWDVDGTLVDTHRVGAQIFAEAFEQATGSPMSEGIARVRGGTEPMLFEQTLALNGVPDAPGLFDAFARVEAEGYRARAAALREHGDVHPGVEEAVQQLDEHPDVVQTLVTGNIAAVARAKVGAFGLDRRLNLELGAYGDDSPVRSELVDLACRRVGASLGRPMPPDDAVVIGDTVRDVEAAHVAGARVVAVTTGTTTAAELAEAGAELVLDSLKDPRLGTFLGTW